ncbi:hypothetical protein B7494_g1364 [Chlorociboria aeruginascens]|nr:hypothetical protein B7494_g1364 [Chlorociboria aeruginascens]
MVLSRREPSEPRSRVSHLDNDKPEDSDDSEPDESDFAETGYPNIELAIKFLVGSTLYKQYKANICNLFRLDVDVSAPISLHEHVVRGDVDAVTRLLEDHFEDIA